MNVTCMYVYLECVFRNKGLLKFMKVFRKHIFFITSSQNTVFFFSKQNPEKYKEVLVAT